MSALRGMFTLTKQGPNKWKTLCGSTGIVAASCVRWIKQRFVLNRRQRGALERSASVQHTVWRRVMSLFLKDSTQEVRLEMVSDAWQRFHGAVHMMTKASPQHRLGIG